MASNEKELKLKDKHPKVIINKDNEITLTISIVGDSNTGKSSIFQRFIGKPFPTLPPRSSTQHDITKIKFVLDYEENQNKLQLFAQLQSQRQLYLQGDHNDEHLLIGDNNNTINNNNNNNYNNHHNNNNDNNNNNNNNKRKLKLIVQLIDTENPLQCNNPNLITFPQYRNINCLLILHDPTLAIDKTVTNSNITEGTFFKIDQHHSNNQIDQIDNNNKFLLPLLMSHIQTPDDDNDHINHQNNNYTHANSHNNKNNNNNNNNTNDISNQILTCPNITNWIDEFKQFGPTCHDMVPIVILCAKTDLLYHLDNDSTTPINPNQTIVPHNNDDNNIIIRKDEKHTNNNDHPNPNSAGLRYNIKEYDNSIYYAHASAKSTRDETIDEMFEMIINIAYSTIADQIEQLYSNINRNIQHHNAFEQHIDLDHENNKNNCFQINNKNNDNTKQKLRQKKECF